MSGLPLYENQEGHIHNACFSEIAQLKPTTNRVRGPISTNLWPHPPTGSLVHRYKLYKYRWPSGTPELGYGGHSMPTSLPRSPRGRVCGLDHLTSHVTCSAVCHRRCPVREGWSHGCGLESSTCHSVQLHSIPAHVKVTWEPDQ